MRRGILSGEEMGEAGSYALYSQNARLQKALVRRAK